MTGGAVVQIEGLVKTFGRFRALDGLDLRVNAGEVHGFLGPNGAGKSTTLRALLGLIRVDAGNARVFGLDPWRDAVGIHRRLAYVPGDVALWPNLTGGEIVDLLLRLRGVPNRTEEKQALAARFGLDLATRAHAYSKGNRQKVALVAAFAGAPELLVLDEPTSGLDPLMEAVFNECVGEHVRRGATVLLSSHILSEVEHLASRVTIIRDGSVVEAGSLDELRHLRRSRVRATLAGSPPDLARIDGVGDLHIEHEHVTFSLDPAALDQVLGLLAGAGVTDLSVTPPSLEELFIDAYRTPSDVAR